MTRAEAIEFLTKNKGRKVRSSTGGVYGWDERLGVVQVTELREVNFVICCDDGDYELLPEEPSLPANFPPNWERVEKRHEAEYMGGGKVAVWSTTVQLVLAEPNPALMLSGGDFYVRVKR